MDQPQDADTPVAADKQTHIWRTRGIVAAIVLLVLLIVGIAGWQRGWFDLFTDLESLRELVRSMGAWGPLAVVAFNVAQAIVSPIPGHALNIVSGYLFGPWLGTLYTLAGILCGNAISLWLVRYLGRPFAERLLGEETLERFDTLMKRRGPIFLFWIFLFPFLPDDAICLMAGLTPLPMLQILLLALVGRAPGLFVANLIGHTMIEFSLWQWVAFGAVLVLLGGLFWRFQETIESFFVQLAQRLSRPR